ncbi:MAG: hypothetical protein U0Y10_06465 [Spirosomataceae bacterium]
MRLFITFMVLSCFPAFAQKTDSLKKIEPLHATANININNNGISLFPNLSFGKPAAIIIVSVGKKNIYFEPELRWGLNGKPWSYIYWFRYKYHKTEKFGINVGAHPSYVLRESAVSINGVLENRFISQRYAAGEVVPTYYFSKKFALGIHYLYSKGLDSYATQNSHFVSLQPKFPNLKVHKDYYFSFYPQVFHLILDDKEGTYVSESLSLNKANYPLSISSIFTYKIKSTIPGDDVVWNVGLNLKL